MVEELPLHRCPSDRIAMDTRMCAAQWFVRLPAPSCNNNRTFGHETAFASWYSMEHFFWTQEPIRTSYNDATPFSNISDWILSCQYIVLRCPRRDYGKNTSFSCPNHEVMHGNTYEIYICYGNKRFSIYSCACRTCMYWTRVATGVLNLALWGPYPHLVRSAD